MNSSPRLPSSSSASAHPSGGCVPRGSSSSPCPAPVEDGRNLSRKRHPCPLLRPACQLCAPREQHLKERSGWGKGSGNMHLFFFWLKVHGNSASARQCRKFAWASRWVLQCTEPAQRGRRFEILGVSNRRRLAQRNMLLKEGTTSLPRSAADDDEATEPLWHYGKSCRREKTIWLQYRGQNDEIPSIRMTL